MNFNNTTVYKLIRTGQANPLWDAARHNPSRESINQIVFLVNSKIK